MIVGLGVVSWLGFAKRRVDRRSGVGAFRRWEICPALSGAEPFCARGPVGSDGVGWELVGVRVRGGPDPFEVAVFPGAKGLFSSALRLVSDGLLSYRINHLTVLSVGGMPLAAHQSLVDPRLSWGTHPNLGAIALGA